MKLTKTDRNKLCGKLCGDFIKHAVDATLEVYMKLSDDALVNSYCQKFDIEKCEHCGQIPGTGACYYCKMD